VRHLLALALLLTGCVTDHPIALELRPPRLPDGGPDVPAEVVAHEVRLYRLGEAERCPELAVVASAAPFGELGHAQVFDAREGMGDAIGEIPPGRYAIAALSRDAECAVHLFGCRLLELGVTPFQTVVVELARVTHLPDCGTCRTCAAGACEPIDAVCR
jgi:hypothetical protein